MILNYRRAQDALEDLIQRLNLSPREMAGLSNPLGNLTGLMDKLDQAVVHIAVFGLVGRGKSSLLNALIGQNIFCHRPHPRSHSGGGRHNLGGRFRNHWSR